MIRCNKCGTLNEAEASFCTECNSYLEWSGEKVRDDSPSPPQPPEDADAVSVAGEPAASATEVPADRGTDSAVPGPDTGTPLPHRQAPGGGDAPTGVSDARNDTAAALPARAPEAAVPEQPSSRRPVKAMAKPASRPTRRPTPTVDLPQPGDLICAVCGSGNDPKRKFCRRCGQGLGAAPAAVAPVRAPWYKRLFRRKTPQTYAAGTRPADLGGGRRWRPGCLSLILGLLLVLGIAGVAAYLSVPAATEIVDDGVAAVTKLVAGPKLAHPAATGPSAAGRPAPNAVDLNLATYWLGPQNERGRWALELRFERAVDLQSVNVHSGADGDQYIQFGRPRQVRLRSGDEDSGIVTLEDVNEIQPIAVDFSGIRELRFIVLNTYRGVPGGGDVAIRELEFEVAK